MIVTLVLTSALVAFHSQAAKPSLSPHWTLQAAKPSLSPHSGHCRLLNHLYRLTGHCRLLNHLYRLRVSHTDECRCGSGIQDAEHVLQRCPRSKILRTETWPTELSLQQKLWENFQDQKITADFIDRTDIMVLQPI
ncbi:hypothetical protein ElyMa_000060800 [Elysia marginata]|uniref:Uncharacterized protein n=1 Tax=Elysia marginata TaxID=1093978 RepID=A0AAV4EGR4_9GAST|nr:hypothetical protein ElyMa_000060800 [Elysia marginata]